MAEDPPKPVLSSEDFSDEALHWIMRLHSGTATAADKRAFAAWRALSDAHEDAAREAETLWDEAENLHVDRKTGIVQPGRRPRGITRRSLVIGAVGLAAASGSLITTGAFRDGDADITTGRGETRTIELSDGSRLTLNARSAINLRFSEKTRRIVLLNGQAFFEVAPDAARSFEVEVGGTVVTAMGTAFDIDKNRHNGGIAISVTEHAVVIRDEKVSDSDMTIQEGQSIVIEPSGHFGPVETRREAVTAAWRSGKYIAENVSLGDVVNALQDYHKGWIFIRGSDTARLRVSAVLDLKAPDASLEALARGLPIVVRHLSPYLVFISPE